MKSIHLLSLFFISMSAFAQTSYTTVPGSRWDDNEKTWILKCIETDENGKRTVITRDITNIYSENVKVGGLDCVDMKEPARDEYDNIYFKHHVFREQTAGKVYQCYGYGDYNALYKSFDFNLDLGEQLERFDYSKYEVTDCGLASAYEPYWSAYCPDRRMLKMHRLDADSDDIWMEGVGSVHTGIFEPSDFNTSEIYVQSMFYGQDDCAFFSIDTDVFKSVPFEAEILETNDPIVEEIIMDQFNNNTTFDIEFIEDTLHVRGALMGETRGTLKTLEAQIEDDVITLSVSEPTFKRITSGLPYRFDVKIPGFKAGKYKIRYSYKNPIEVVCQGDATVIEELKNTDTPPIGFDSDVIYDLSGRRLNQVPERGLYIQNGKVIFR